MDIVVDLATLASPARVHEVVTDLGRYPEFLDIVAAAVPLPGAERDPGPAWSVDLRGQLGPFRRTKRLRMVRVADGADRVAFERWEVDGRRHSPWRLEVGMAPDGTGTAVTMRLHYGGSLWMSPLDRLLEAEIERSRPRFRDLVEASRSE